MEYRFKMIKEGKKYLVLITKDVDDKKDRIEVAKIEAKDPLIVINELIKRVKIIPDLIFRAEFIIIGADITLEN